MEYQKLTDLIPAISMLLSAMIVTLVIVLKFGDKIFDNGLKNDNTLIIVVVFLFTFVLTTHLFKEQAWTADILKILIGALIGAGSVKLTQSKEAEQVRMGMTGNDIRNSVVNQALGDISQKIESFKSEMSNFENAVINQYPAIEKRLESIQQDQSKPHINMQFSMRLETGDETLLEHLEELRKSDDWQVAWLEAVLNYPEFRQVIKEKLKKIETEGWEFTSLKLIDNVNRGVIIGLDVRKPYVH